jgi:hypothetical protein
MRSFASLFFLTHSFTSLCQFITSSLYATICDQKSDHKRPGAPCQREIEQEPLKQIFLRQLPHTTNTLATLNVVPKNTDGLEDVDLENTDEALGYVVARDCQEILANANGNCLRAVELANALRERVGVKLLACVKSE